MDLPCFLGEAVMTQKDPRFSGPRNRPTLEPGTSNVALLMLASAFLVVTIVLVLLQPRINRPTTAPTAVEVAGGLPVPAPAAAPQVVARAPQPVFETLASAPELPGNAAKAIAKELRQPIRLSQTDTALLDLNALTLRVLGDLAPAAQGQDVDPNLVKLVVESVLQRQSDTYIHVLLNTAHDRGRIRVPTALLTAGGRVDSLSLLTALVHASGAEQHILGHQVTTPTRHLISAEDSLARLALGYYGDAAGVTKLLEANPQLDPSTLSLVPGETLLLPES